MKYFHTDAVLGGSNQQYRYWLEREFALAAAVRTVGFIGYNPSTADATLDDQTIRKEVAFALRWGYTRMIKANLYAWRATNPKALKGLEDPVGPENHTWLTRLFEQSEIVVCAWGSMPVTGYGLSLATWAMGKPTARCLGRTKNGGPKHTCYLPYTTPLEEIR